MAKDANGNDLKPGVTYQKGTRRRTFLGYDMYFIVYRNGKNTVADGSPNVSKWFAKSVPVERDT